MSDANATIRAVDEAMDMIDAFSKEVHDLRAHASFEINEIMAVAESKRRVSEAYRDLAYRCAIRGEELKDEWTRLCLDIIDQAEEAKRVLGAYIRKLGRISGNSGQKEPEYYVVIVDSQKYPQIAEHIKRAQKMGSPEFVTLERGEAADRRKASLANIKVRNIYDRDEWPMAVFKEGGEGANVVYIESRDNRGAGSSIGWQMRKLPNGAKVRVRVI